MFNCGFLPIYGYIQILTDESHVTEGVVANVYVYVSQHANANFEPEINRKA